MSVVSETQLSEPVHQLAIATADHDAPAQRSASRMSASDPTEVKTSAVIVAVIEAVSHLVFSPPLGTQGEKHEDMTTLRSLLFS